MSHKAEISRSNPTCFFFLVDQSSSMLDPIMGIPENGKKADFVASALNKTIQTLVVTASKDIEVRKYYQIGAIGYGNMVSPALGSTHQEKELIWIDELASNPIRIEERMKKENDGAGGFIEVPTKFPVWIDPVANGNTPMCEAIERTKVILEKWVKEHPLSYPPTVINLTDGEANDGDPREPSRALKELATSDGNTILINVHVSSNPYSQQIFFPNVDEGLPDSPSKIMFEMSSPITESMLTTAQNLLGSNLAPNAKGFVYNAEIAGIVSALEIGTRPANLR